jgi:hypothetical protein
MSAPAVEPRPPAAIIEGVAVSGKTSIVCRPAFGANGQVRIAIVNEHREADIWLAPDDILRFAAQLRRAAKAARLNAQVQS